MIVEGDLVRSRLLSPREAARLMGLPDSYKLPANYNDAYGLMGDGVVGPGGPPPGGAHPRTAFAVIIKDRIHMDSARMREWHGF